MRKLSRDQCQCECWWGGISSFQLGKLKQTHTVARWTKVRLLHEDSNLRIPRTEWVIHVILYILKHKYLNWTAVFLRPSTKKVATVSSVNQSLVSQGQWQGPIQQWPNRKLVEFSEYILSIRHRAVTHIEAWSPTPRVITDGNIVQTNMTDIIEL